MRDYEKENNLFNQKKGKINKIIKINMIETKFKKIKALK